MQLKVVRVGSHRNTILIHVLETHSSLKLTEIGINV